MMWSDREEFQIPGLASALRRQCREDRERARDFAAEIRNLAVEVDQRFEAGDRSLMPEVTAALAKWNWLSWWMPSFWGGKGRPPLTALAVLEELGRECLGFSNVLGAHFVGYSILSTTWNLPLIGKISLDVSDGEANGEARLITAALTEPSAGSDLEDQALLARAERSIWARRLDDDSYSLSGSKHFISNSAWAAWHVVVAPVENGSARWKKSEHTAAPYANAPESMIAVIPANRKGLVVGIPERKLGQHACPASALYFDEVQVHRNEIALDSWQFNSLHEFETFSKLMHEDVLSMSRPGVAAMSSGATLRILDECVRVLGAKAGRQQLQHDLANLAGDAMLARQSAWTTMQRFYSTGPMAQMGSERTERLSQVLPSFMCKILGRALILFDLTSQLRKKRLALKDERASEIRFGWSALTKAAHAGLAEQSARAAIQMLGAETISRAPVIFKILRDAKLLSIYEGTTTFNELSVYSAWLANTDAVNASPFSEEKWN